MKSKHYFESQEYQYFNPEKNQFFSIAQNCLYEIRKNSPEEIIRYRCDYSLYNLSKKTRVSGLYQTAKNPSRFNFDYLGEVYYLEVLKDALLIQFLYNKDFSTLANQGKNKEFEKAEKPKSLGLW